MIARIFRKIPRMFGINQCNKLVSVDRMLTVKSVSFFTTASRQRETKEQEKKSSKHFYAVMYGAVKKM